jgi:tetratricopeptide (TPR) repeat protein
MIAVKRAGLLLIILIVAAADILIYMNTHLFYQAEKVEENEKKLEILDEANKIYPLNDQVNYSLGKANLDMGLERLSSLKESELYLRKASENFRRSIRLNPASSFSHFYFAQSLFNLSLFSNASDSSFYEEYKKAAELTSQNTQIFYEVGKTYLSLWSLLSDKERTYTLDLVKKIFEGKNKERIFSLLNVWELNVEDFKVLEQLLPQDSAVYRLYADWLGEKAIFIEQRQRSLAKAESMEFEEAKAECQAGESEAFYYRWGEAEQQFTACLNRLKTISFYQDLVDQRLVDNSEYIRYRRLSLLGLAKCRLEQGKKLSEVEDLLREYLDKTASVGELETYLVESRLIIGKPSEKFDDLGLLSFQLLFLHKQNRNSEIMDLGRLLQNSFVVIPEGKKGDYINVLQVIGNSLQRLDYLYEAIEFYKKALELDPKNLETLVRIRQSYAKLNNEAKVQETSSKIKDIISSEINFKNRSLKKEEGFSQALIFDGQKMVVDLFLNQEQGVPPLISVLFNGRVVWENIVESGNISIPVQTRVGKNIIRITSLNRPVSLLKIVCRYENEEKT